MKALVLRSGSSNLEIEEVEETQLQQGEVKVRVLFSALNHRDQWIREGKYAKIMYPAILGSDGVGEVVEVFGDDLAHLVGTTVIINPNIGWGAKQKAQLPTYSILGMPTKGTFAEFVVVSADRVHPVPTHCSLAEASAMPLAALTAYRAVASQAKTTTTERVLITGAGGGVALFALQFAVALGAEVYVTSGSQEKIENAVRLGAKGGALYSSPTVISDLKSQCAAFDVIIDSTGGEQLNQLLNLCDYGARIVSYGATCGTIPDFDIRKVFWKQISLLGSTMGSDSDFREMLAFVSSNSIVPIVHEVIPITQAQRGFDALAQAKQTGKIVFKHTWN